MVTTEHRGVFFGYGDYAKAAEPTIELKKARMAVYWPQDTYGVLGLANAGPGKGARISPAAPVLILRDVTSVAQVSDTAVTAWESAPWSR